MTDLDKITPEEFTNRLNALLDSDDFDTEWTHRDIDQLLIDTLTSLGYDVSRNKTDEWWYA